MSTIFKTPREAILYAGSKFKDGFNLDDPTRLDVYRKAFYCLTGSDAATNLGIKPNKGILLVGNIGVGKTLMMRVLQRLFKDTERRFRWVEVSELSDLIRAKAWGDDTILTIKEMYGQSLKMDLYIDDIGFENVDLHLYNNHVNVVAELLEDRYKLFQKEGFRTHLSTNLRTSGVEVTAAGLTQSIESLYGDRILDRIKEMTNLIRWEGASLRR